MGNISCMNDWAEKVWPTWHGCHIGRSEKDQPSNLYFFSWRATDPEKMKIILFRMNEKFDKVWTSELNFQSLRFLKKWKQILLHEGEDGQGVRAQASEQWSPPPPSWKPPPEKCPTIEICCRRKSWHLLRGSFSILMEKNMGTKVWPLD